MTADQNPPLCPRCSCRLLWNGRVMACISCSYTTREAKSDQRIPAVKRRKKHRGPEGPSGA